MNSNYYYIFSDLLSIRIKKGEFILLHNKKIDLGKKLEHCELNFSGEILITPTIIPRPPCKPANKWKMNYQTVLNSARQERSIKPI